MDTEMANDNKLRELERKEHEVREELLYVRAEMDNFRKTADRDTAALKRAGEQALLRQLVPVAGLLKSAILTARREENDPMAVGLEMISKQLLAVMRKFGMAMTAHLAPPTDPAPDKTTGE